MNSRKTIDKLFEVDPAAAPPAAAPAAEKSGRTFRTTWWEKTSEEDRYNEGCVGGGQTMSGNDTLKAATFQELVKKAKQWAGGLETSNYVFLPDGVNSNGFSFSQMETEDSGEPSEEETAAWKRGKFKLYLADYHFGFEIVVQATLEASDLEGLEHDN